MAKEGSKENLKLADLLNYKDPAAVLAMVGSLYRAVYPSESFSSVEKAFALVSDLYTGRYPGYQACNTEYHDFCHVLEVFCSTARLLDGRNLTHGPYAPADESLLLIAALLHDTGYIQTIEDDEGTGAKYTATHVRRSADFAVAQASAFGLSSVQAEKAARLIIGTDMALKWENIVYLDEEERELAAVLAAADLLGQMGDRAYLEKLLFLYYEYREAGVGNYKSAFDILQKTLGFYEIVKKRIDGPLGSTAGLARAHFKVRAGVDRDLYTDAIERQMDYLRGIVADNSSNFRKKLKRMDLEKVSDPRRAKTTA